MAFTQLAGHIYHSQRWQRALTGRSVCYACYPLWQRQQPVFAGHRPAVGACIRSRRAQNEHRVGEAGQFCGDLARMVPWRRVRLFV